MSFKLTSITVLKRASLMHILKGETFNMALVQRHHLDSESPIKSTALEGGVSERGERGAPKEEFFPVRKLDKKIDINVPANELLIDALNFMDGGIDKCLNDIPPSAWEI